MTDIAVVISTFDRSPRANYLPETLANLERAGVFLSDRLHGLHLVDSGSASDWPLPALDALSELIVHVHPSAVGKVSAKQNCARALRIGAESGAQWVLHLEDDLDVCADFLGSVGRWLDRWYTADRALYAFSSDNAFIEHCQRHGLTSWEYPVDWFWGFQCFAMRPEAAISLAAWLEAHPIYTHHDGRPDENAHDLEAHRWAAHYGHRYFRGSVPSFVQHIGIETSIPGNAQGGKLVRFPSWPGRDWTFTLS